MKKNRPVITFVVKTYPKISETFILQEILALQHRGYPLLIASLQKPTDSQQHPEVSEVTSPVIYLDRETCNAWNIMICVAHCLVNAPIRFFKTLVFVCSGQQTSITFLQSVCLAMQIRRNGIRHIHAHFASEPATVAVLVQQLTGTGFSISAHAKDIYLSTQTALKRKIARARFVVSCTQYNCDYLEQITEASTPIVCVYHGINMNRFTGRTNRNKTLADSRAPRILSVGRLREKKGFETLLSACQLLSRNGYRMQCDIVGYGPLHEQLESMIIRLNLKDIVTLKGQLNHSDLVTLYDDTDIFALPCQIGEDGDRDGIPNVLMEAMAFEIPVISTRISGIPELVEDHVSGLLIEPDNPQQL
ncbi:MAG: glycosyltransferase, partial [Gammaproteobacteria bacterium]|nr:glycosyltransferase [Gammaproteobacteria bacterium]